MKVNYENWFELKRGMLIRAKRDLHTSTRLWNNPGPSTLKKDTVLMVPSYGTRYGDVGPCIVGLFDAEGNFTPAFDSNGPVVKGDDFLREGHKSRCPEDLGLVDPSAFELVGQLEGEAYEFYRKQAPHICHQLKVKPLVLVHKDGEFTFDEGYYNDNWIVCYDGVSQ